MPPAPEHEAFGVALLRWVLRVRLVRPLLLLWQQEISKPPSAAGRRTSWTVKKASKRRRMHLDAFEGRLTHCLCFGSCVGSPEASPWPLAVVNRGAALAPRHAMQQDKRPFPMHSMRQRSFVQVADGPASSKPFFSDMLCCARCCPGVATFAIAPAWVSGLDS